MEIMKIKSEIIPAVLPKEGRIVSFCDIEEITNIVIDSREANKGSLFIPIIGETLDGHTFAQDAYANGCRVFLKQTGHELNIPTEDTTIFEVPSTEIALGDIAHRYKNKFDIPFIGITGSVGKTSTRDMVYSVISSQYNTLKNKKNFNNQLGVPLTLFNLNKEHESAVIEMGMSGFKEIEYLSHMVKPKVGIITNIGQSHIEKLGSADGIFQAKMEITSSFDVGNVLILNGDDEHLKKVKGNPAFYRVKSFGFSSDNTIYCSKYQLRENSTEFSCVIDGEEFDFTIPTAGVHNIYNAMAAILTGLELNIPITKIQEGLSSLEMTGMRFEVEKVNDLTIINDAYNASPDSMKAALNSLSMYQGRRVAILGDMFEMGDYSKDGHESVGSYIPNKADILITIGNDSKYISDKAIKNGFEAKNVYHFNSKEDSKISELIQENDTVLVKASRGMKLETIIETLKNIKFN